MNVIIQILKVNPLREGVGKQSGNPYRMQDCEAILLNADGTPDEVGVLMLSKEQVGNFTAGFYRATFALRASKAQNAGRRIEAFVTGLDPLQRTANGFIQAPAKAPAKAPVEPAKA